MNIVYAVISYNICADREMNIAGWTTDEQQARALESRLNNITESYISPPLVEYYTTPIHLYGAPTEYKAYSDFDALTRNGLLRAIVPAGQGEYYRYLCGDADVIYCRNMLEGLE